MDPQELQATLNQLETEHRDLDSTIQSLMELGMPDQLQIARLKKRKLRIKDEIVRVRGQLIPDIIA